MSAAEFVVDGDFSDSLDSAATGKTRDIIRA